MNTAEQVFISLLRNCKTLNTIKQLHSYSIKTGLDNDPFIVGKLIHHTAVLLPNSIHCAHRLLRHFSNPDVFMYNTLIRGFSESYSPLNSLTTFIDMCRNSTAFLDSYSFAFIFKATAKLRCLNVGSQLYCQAIKHGLDTHVFVGTTGISMFAECGCVEFAKKVFVEMSEPNVVSWNAIVTACFWCFDVKGAEMFYNQMPFKNLTSNNIVLAGYIKLGDVLLAKKLFFEMPVKDEVSWSTMIVGFSQNGFFDDAFSFFRELMRVGRGTNESSLTGVLSACAQAGAFEFGRILHGYVEKAGFVWMSTVNNALLDTYAKCGNVDMARLVFQRMSGLKSIVSWTSMMAGLAMQGYGEDTIALFHDMEESGIRPDGITFISLLYACSHVGMVEKGCTYFNMMKNNYGIEPAIEHYGCMVDLYGRAGQLTMAYDFVIRMPIQPNAIIWRTLLGACSIHGNVELAEEVRQRLKELDPKNSGDHVLLSNIYATAGKWKDAATARSSMTSQRLKKSPGWSMIEVDKTMYRFVAGETLTEITKEAYSKLEEIMLKLRVEGGYVPEVGGVLHDIEEEEKENSVSKHSEKLAVAFGISRLCGGSVIRVVKNLRVCKDCHTMMKLISKVYGIEIVLRDRSRFHTFRDSYCSCKDYW